MTQKQGQERPSKVNEFDIDLACGQYNHNNNVSKILV